MESATIDLPTDQETEGNEYSSVENVCRKFNVFLVHKVIPRFIEKDTDWTPLKEGLTDVSLLTKIVVATGPEISCSTIAEGDSVENFCREEDGIGLLINRGTITFAGASDAFTTFDEDGKKVQEKETKDVFAEDSFFGLTPFAKQKLGGKVRSEQDIAFAIQNRRKSMAESYRFNFTPYNEFAVQNPKVGALFTVLKDYGIRGESDIDSYFRRYDREARSLLVDQAEAKNMDTVASLRTNLDVPSYIFYRGKFYKIDRTEHVEPTQEQYRERRVYLGEPVMVDEFLDLQNPLQKDPSKRKELVKDIYSAKPFKDSNVKRLVEK